MGALGGSGGWRLKEGPGQMILQAHSFPDVTSLLSSNTVLGGPHSVPGLECYHTHW